MKKNWKDFWFVVIVLILSILAFLSIDLGLWKDLSNPKLLQKFFGGVVIIFAMAFGWIIRGIVTKRTYHWSQLEEKSYFTIVWISGTFKNPIPDITPGLSEILIMVPGTGDTLVLFPTYRGPWINSEPKVGERWKRVGSNFIRE